MKKIYLTLLLMVLGAPVLWAQIYVTETGGAVTRDGQTWATAYDKTQLQQAINEAEAATVKQVWVAKGVYVPTVNPMFDGTNASTDPRDRVFLMKREVSIYGGFAGGESSIDDRVDIHTTNRTILSGDFVGNDIADPNNPSYAASKADNAYHVVIVVDGGSSTDAPSYLDGLTISGGYADGTGTTGISSTTTIRLERNRGAGITSRGAGAANVTYSNLIIEDNASSNFGGGAYFLTSSAGRNHAFEQVTFKNNTATASGGGLYISGTSASVTFTDAVFEGNEVNTSGGAIYLTSASLTLKIEKSIFKNNKSLGNAGAIILFRSGSDRIKLEVSSSRFYGNTSGTGAGAIFGGTYVDMNVNNSVFYNNLSEATTAVSGVGAIFINENATGTIINSTFYNNKSTQDGYGVLSFNNGTSTTVNLYNNIFEENKSNYDKDNDTGTSADVRDATGAYQTYSYNLFQNLIENSSNNRRIVVVPYYLDGTNPQTVFASTTEGAYNFLWPIENSFAINKGDNALYDNNVENITTPSVPVPTDLLGNPRLVGTNIDLGAIEWSSVLPVTASSFTANLVNGRTQLKWSVGTEDNVSHYEVQRSQNGIDFTTVATVKANGSASYQAADNQPQAGTNYYRLVTVDNDGSLSVYKDLQTVKVASLSAPTVQVYPNPVKGNEVKVSLGGAAGTYSYKLVNTSGSVVQQGSVNYNGSSAVISVASLPAGLYIIQFSDGMQAKLVRQ